jgi:glycosyltransferase involved in cell wall biosynthesis
MTDGSESILVITQYFPPETGASQTRWDELSKRWGKKASVAVVTSAPDYPEGEIYDGYDNQWLRREKRGSVDVFYTKTITSSSGNLLRRSLKFVWFMLISMIVGLRYVSPSVVIATSPQPLTGISAWVIARVKRATFVFEVRDLWPESILAVSDFDSRLVIWLLERTVTFLYRRSDHLIVLSKAFIEPIVDCDVDRSKIAFHPNGIDLAFYDVEGDDSPVIEDLDKEFTISYVGTIGRAHGLSVVLEAASELDNIQFVIVGDGSERKVLETRAEGIDNVIFTGRRHKKEVPAILNKSDVALVHLKSREIFETVIPSKLLESMAAELPVILGVRGEAERILMQANGGITMTPEQSDELVTAARQLQTDPEKRRTLAASGRTYVAENFNWEAIADAYFATITVGPE